jgi:hypothetical protein
VPNGWDKNWSRFLITVAGFKAAFGEWPEEMRLNPDLLHDLKSQVFSPDRFAELEQRIRMVPDHDPNVTLRAVGGGRSFDYGASDGSGADGAATVAWLGVEPDDPVGYDKIWPVEVNLSLAEAFPGREPPDEATLDFRAMSTFLIEKEYEYVAARGCIVCGNTHLRQIMQKALTTGHPRPAEWPYSGPAGDLLLYECGGCGNTSEFVFWFWKDRP